VIIAGRPGWKSRAFYEALSKHPFLDDIILTGYLPRQHLASLYSQAIALIFPSLYEGFGLPVVEAMSCGTPCLLSKTSSLPEVGGKAALYFDPEDPDAIAKSMLKIYNNKSLREALSEEALKQAAKFSWKEYARILDREIKKL
jgi:glycosyltransferase involved in cell wall biosynthesis